MNPTAQVAPTTPMRCGGCNAFMDSPLYCGGCHTLFPPESASHFEMLGVPEAYDLDPAALRQHYLAASRNVHPDRVKPDEQSLSLRVSAMLNDAYRILSDPLTRAEYLLERCGGPSASEDKTVPPAVLNETLMLRSDIDDAKEAGDTEALTAARAQATAGLDRVREKIDTLARRLPGDVSLRTELRASLNSVRYYQRALAQFENA